jgi:parallel beta-helix repeat protein
VYQAVQGATVEDIVVGKMNSRAISIVVVSMILIAGVNGLLNIVTMNSEGTSVSGSIDTDTTWDLAGSPYNVVNHITVEADVTLTIDPGVVVMFNGAYIMTVDGNLTAEGNETDMILITSNKAIPAKQQWNRIEVNPGGHAEISYCNISCATTGLKLESSYNNVTKNIFWLNYWGIQINSAFYNNISENNISNCNYGVHTYNSRFNNFARNNVSSCFYYGFFIWATSDDNTFVQNNISHNRRGIFLFSSSSQNITDNDFTYNGVIINGGGPTSHNIPTDNLVNGKPLYYHKNENNLSIDGIPVGQLIFANCDNVMVQNLDINQTDSAVQIYGSKNVTVLGCNLSWNNLNGMAVYTSSDINITGNNVLGNDDYGIYLESSGNNIIGNNVSYNEQTGIRLLFTSDNNIAQNEVIQNLWQGIFIDSSDYNNVISNTISYNALGGLGLDQTTYHNISNNDFFDDGIFITGEQLSHYNTHTIPTSNQVNGKPIYYYKNQSGMIIDSIPAGQLILANCTDSKILNLDMDHTDSGIIAAYCTKINLTGILVTYNDLGIYMYSSWENQITLCNASFNVKGMELTSSWNNNITESNLFQNSFCGIILSSSNQNLVYHNNFLNNSDQAIDSESDNSWDLGYPHGGNYWSDYGGSDYFKGPNQDILGGDKIGDTLYVIDADSRDNYPLVGPSNFTTLENYTVLRQGWNLISIPLIQEEENLTKVLEMINGYYDAVQWHDPTDLLDPWKHNKVGKPYGNDLFLLNETMGFWIHITQPQETIFIYNGTPPSVNQSITLHPGWNLVGYPSETVYNRTEALNTIDFGLEVDMIMWYDTDSQTTQRMGAYDYFVKGRGYYIHAKSECVWEVPL